MPNKHAMARESKPFKYYYGVELARELGHRIAAVHSSFVVETFVAQVASQVDELELKDRVAAIAAALRDHLPADYPKALKILLSILEPEHSDAAGMFVDGYQLMPMAYFVEVYGLNDFEASIAAMYEITKRHTAEFAIRPFLMRYPEQTLAVLAQWTEDQNPHIRRLVSEGTRPRLPWAAQLSAFRKNPRPVLALLERLKDDPSPYVQKSVANNLNDMLKDNPEVALETLTRWHADTTEQRRWIIRHALRNRIKAGDLRALYLLGYGEPKVALRYLRLTPKRLQLGESLHFSFTLQSDMQSSQDLIIDYLIHFLRANGKRNPKVFKLTTRRLDRGASIDVHKRHPVRPVTTRRYYPGPHRLEIQVNGKVLGGADFDLEL